eukprot:SAG31_NODE_5872_length_2280_cov_84.549289_4_plen_52_part_01
MKPPPASIGVGVYSAVYPHLSHPPAVLGGAAAVAVRREPHGGGLDGAAGGGA